MTNLSLSTRSINFTNYIATLIAAFLCTLLIFATLFFDIDPSEKLMAGISHLHLDNYELDEVGLAAFIIMLGVTIDLFRQKLNEKQRRKLHADRLRTMRSTMATVDDIINNFLNNMALFCSKAQLGDVLNHEEIELLESEIIATKEKLQQIHDLEVIVERDLGQEVSCLKLDTEQELNSPEIPYG